MFIPKKYSDLDDKWWNFPPGTMSEAVSYANFEMRYDPLILAVISQGPHGLKPQVRLPNFVGQAQRSNRQTQHTPSFVG